MGKAGIKAGKLKNKKYRQENRKHGAEIEIIIIRVKRLGKYETDNVQCEAAIKGAS